MDLAKIAEIQKAVQDERKAAKLVEPVAPVRVGTQTPSAHPLQGVRQNYPLKG
jgi:hypothetical protein